MAVYKEPVIIGVGEVKNPSRSMEDAIEPLHLMISAIKAAAQDALPDCPMKIIKGVDGVSVVASSTWPYQDLPKSISDELGIFPSHQTYSDLSGNSPVQLLDNTARLIAKGEIEMGIITGGEALASLKTYMKTDNYPPPWTAPREHDRVYYANDTDMLDGIGRAHRVGVPMQVYAMYENGLRAHRHQTPTQNLQESAALYGQWAKVAARHPVAWTSGRQPETAETIGTITNRNRMICFPYPLLMNAFNDVNLAGACIVTSTECARRIGIKPEKWIYPLGGGRGNDSADFWNRPSFHTSRAIATALDMCLKSSGLRSSEINMFDLYSCFPVVPKLACRHLGIPLHNPPVPITLLGGLTSFGGAGANYSMHAIAEMVRQLRMRHHGRSPARGLILANGGTLTCENAICLSTEPRESHTVYPLLDILPDTSIEQPPQVEAEAEGEAVIETYTVEYERENKPRLGHIVCRLKSNGHRVIANHGDLATLEQLVSWVQEPIGRAGYVHRSSVVDKQNLFSFSKPSKL